MADFAFLLHNTPDVLLPALFRHAERAGTDALRALGARVGLTDPKAASCTVPSLFTGSQCDHAARFFVQLLEKGKYDDALAFYESLAHASNDAPWANSIHAKPEFHRHARSALMRLSPTLEQVQRLSAALEVDFADAVDYMEVETAPTCSSVVQWVARTNPQRVEKAFLRTPIKRKALLVAAAAINGPEAAREMLAAHPLWVHDHPNHLDRRQKFLLDVLTFLYDNKETQELFARVAPAIASMANPQTALDIGDMDQDHVGAIVHAGPSPLLEALHASLLSQRPDRQLLAFAAIKPDTVQKMLETGLPVSEFRSAQGDTFMHMVLHVRPGAAGEASLMVLGLHAPELAFIPNDQGVRAIDMIQDPDRNMPALAQWLLALHTNALAQKLDTATQDAPRVSKPARF